MSLGTGRNHSLLCRMLIAGALVAAAPAALAQSSPPEGALTPEQKTAIEHVVHDYLLSHPELMIDVLQAAKEQQQRQTEQHAQQVLKARRSELLDDPTSPVGGNVHGDVTVVEFFDYRCPYCKRMHPTLRELLAADRKLRIAYKEWPILGPVSVTAARAALAAHLQGKYEAFHNPMMTATGEITEDTVYRIAGSVGLDLERLKRDMASPQIEAALKANRDIASALDIHGTPTFVIGDQLVPGAIDLSAIEDLVAGARKK